MHKILFLLFTLFTTGCAGGKMLLVSENEQHREDLTWIESTVKINATIDKVWKFVAEEFDQNSRFTPDVEKSHFIDKKTNMVGSVRTAILTSGDSFDVKIIAYNTDSKFIEWELIRATMVETGVASYTLSDMKGSTKVTLKGGFKMQYFFMDWIARMKYPDGFKGILAGMKLYLEKGIELKEKDVEKIVEEYGDQIHVEIL